MYQNGHGTPQDYKEAIKWWTKAAEQGDVHAQFNLGVAYARGAGTPQDYVMAHMLWNIAAANGDEGAKSNRDEVEGMMTPNQIEQARQLAKEWMKKY
jgi:TPR repeat protein